MHGASKIIVKYIKHQNQTEDISNISEDWSEWSVIECEIKVGIIIHLSYFCGNIRKGKKIPWCIFKPGVGILYKPSVPGSEHRSIGRTENQISKGGGKETIRMNCSVNFN